MDRITQARINAQMLAVLAELLARRVRDPRVTGVTLTGVEVTNDLAYATVHFSLLGGDEARRLAQRGLDKVGGFLRGELGRRLRMRSVPQLRFRWDPSLETGQRIETLLRQWREEKAAPGAGAPRADGDASGDEEDHA